MVASQMRLMSRRWVLKVDFFFLGGQFDFRRRSDISLDASKP